MQNENDALSKFDLIAWVEVTDDFCPSLIPHGGEPVNDSGICVRKINNQWVDDDGNIHQKAFAKLIVVASNHRHPYFSKYRPDEMPPPYCVRVTGGDDMGFDKYFETPEEALATSEVLMGCEVSIGLLSSLGFEEG